MADLKTSNVAIQVLGIPQKAPITSVAIHALGKLKGGWVSSLNVEVLGDLVTNEASSTGVVCGGTAFEEISPNKIHSEVGSGGAVCGGGASYSFSQLLDGGCRFCNTFSHTGEVSGGVRAGGTALVTDNIIGGGVRCGGSAYVDNFYDIWDGATFVLPLDGEYVGESYEVDDLTRNNLDGTGGDGDAEDCPTLDDGVFCLGSQNFMDTEFIDLPPDNMDTGQFSFSMWGRINGYFLERTFYTRGYDTANGDEWTFRLGHSVVNHLWASIQVTGSEGTETHHCFSSTLLDQERWYHLGCSFDGTSLKVYINGVLSGTTVVGLPMIGLTNSSYLGRWNDGLGLEGNIQEARMYPEAKSAAWFKAEHDNFCSSAFYRIGETETLEV